MTYKVSVYVTLKENILDPQGKAVRSSLQSLGYDEVSNVRIGKYLELEVEAGSRQAAEERLKEMCEKLLANTVIEDYRFELTEV